LIRLSASYGIIQRHRGRIELLDREEGGTAVEISLPVHRAVIRESRGGDPSVLVLSEEQQTARQLRRMMGDAARAAGAAETQRRPEAA
jgi:hypothetical protein